MRILERYVLGELLRVFCFALTGLTILLIVVGVVDKALRSGLGPVQIVKILPYIVPSLLPFTIPATLLLTVCVVYGRISGDQEVTATKAAGINVLALLWPSFFLGAVMSVCTLVLTDQFIPWARSNIERVVMLAMEDIFLDSLRQHNQISKPEHGITITVTRVEGKKLITPTFRINQANGGTITIQAEEATLEFDLRRQQVTVNLFRAHIETPGAGSAWVVRDTQSFPLPIHMDKPSARDIPMQAIEQELKEVRDTKTDMQHKRLIMTAFAMTDGSFERLTLADNVEFDSQMQQQDERTTKLNTELHNRVALACSCFFFVLVGSPVSILLARRQFLTNFMICFMPILLMYYPIMLLSMTLAKSKMLNPAWGVWIGNVLLLGVGIYVLRKVLKH